MLKKVSLFHPFTANAIGISEAEVLIYHSQPHERALEQMPQSKYRITIDYFSAKPWPFNKTISVLNKRFWPLSHPIIGNRHVWRGQYSLWHYLHNILAAPDLTIINMSGHGSKYCFKLAKLLQKKNKPYIAMLGGINITQNKSLFDYYKGAHHLIVHTNYQKEKLQKDEFFKNLHIEVLPLGIDTDSFLPLKKDKDVFTLLFVGRISRLKQIEKGIEAVAHLKKNTTKKIIFNIIGPSSDINYLFELKELAKTLNVINSVNFIGALNQKRLVPYYQKASLFILPSKHESFGIVMVEAMACGTPVIGFKKSWGPDEIIEDSINGILTTEDKFKECILEFAKDEETQIRLGKNARMVTLKKWTIAHTRQLLQKNIESALK